jgi:hypothetical protein
MIPDQTAIIPKTAPKIAQLSDKTMDIHRFSSSHETCPERTCPEPVEGAEWVPLALPQFSGYKIA